MIVLHPNEDQYNALNSYKNNASELLFVKDGSGRFIVGIEVLNDPNFSEIREQLLELEQITYIPAE
jgi:hypothetical protein